MTQIRRRLGRAAVFFLVGALTLLPVSAFASPSSGPTGDDLVGFDSQYQAKDDDKSEDKDRDGDKSEDKDRDGDKSKSNDKDDDKSKSKDKDDDDPKSKDKDDDKSKSKDKDDDKSKSKDNDAVAGAAVPVADGRGPSTPSDGRAEVTPPLSGLGSVDTKSLPVHLGAAIVLFQHDGDDQNGYGQHLGVAALAPEPTEHPTNKVSASIIRTLTPILPPVAVDVVAAPLVVVEALIEAMASSGQALVIPFLAGAAGFFATGARRKELLTQAIDPDSDDHF